MTWFGRVSTDLEFGEEVLVTTLVVTALFFALALRRRVRFLKESVGWERGKRIRVGARQGYTPAPVPPVPHLVVRVNNTRVVAPGAHALVIAPHLWCCSGRGLRAPAVNDDGS